jgi:putative transposase
MIEPGHTVLSIKRQCELIGLSRSSYYRQPAPEREKNLELMKVIDEIYTRFPFFGSRKIRDYLIRRDYEINRKRIQRLMRLMGLASVAPVKKTTLPNRAHKIYPYLLKNLYINRANQVWCSDITYIRLRHGFVFLTVVMDWYSRHVLSWELSTTMDDSFCTSALERALRRYGCPETFNTDQGSQYTGSAFTGILKDHGIRISMDGKGRAMDNIMVERLWRSLKYEDIYLKDYETVRELTDGLRMYFDFYNHERPHQRFGTYTPAEIYRGDDALQEAA